MSDDGTSLNTHDIANRLLGYEAGGQHSSDEIWPATVQVCLKLGRPLSRLLGETGSRAMLSRALTLAKREADVLGTVRLTEDGVLEGLSREADGASSLLVVHFIGLVITFLGEGLTLRLLQDIWPEQTLSDVSFGERRGNESV